MLELRRRRRWREATPGPREARDVQLDGWWWGFKGLMRVCRVLEEQAAAALYVDRETPGGSVSWVAEMMNQKGRATVVDGARNQSNLSSCAARVF